MMKRVLSQDQNVWARGMAPIGGPSRCKARHDIKAKYSIITMLCLGK